MPNVGPMEIAVVAVIALIIFGPKRLPELGKSLGRGLTEFRTAVTSRHEVDEHGPVEMETAPAPGARRSTTDVGSRRT